MSPSRRLLLSVLILIAVFFVGAAGYMVIEADKGIAPFDAAYMTAITLSTVGFHDQWELSRTAQWWTMGVITFGIAAVSVAFTSLITLFVSGDIRSLREQRKMKTTIDQMTGHTIICGYGRMGAMLTGELMRRSVRVVVLEQNHEGEEDLRENGIAHLNGDATEEDALVSVGVKRAAALVVTLPHDADNVFITLTARALNPNLLILSRAVQPSTEAKLRRAGANRVVCPAMVGATTIANMLTRPNVVDFVEIANQGVKLEMDEFVVDARSPLLGHDLRESHLREQTGAIVVAIKRADGKTLYSPKPDVVFEAGDTLIIVGPAGVSARLIELTQSTR